MSQPSKLALTNATKTDKKKGEWIDYGDQKQTYDPTWWTMQSMNAPQHRDFQATRISPKPIVADGCIYANLFFGGSTTYLHD